jgi:hypothetical protein
VALTVAVVSACPGLARGFGLASTLRRMAINPKTLEQTELDLETARGQFAALQLDPTVTGDSKLVAAAIAQAGAEIALAIVRSNGDSDS